MGTFDGNLIKQKLSPQAYTASSFTTFPDFETFVESATVDTIVTLTQAQYDAIVTKDPNTLYHITA